jgi:hypothetical protein
MSLNQLFFVLCFSYLYRFSLGNTDFMPKQSETQLLFILLKKVPHARNLERLMKPENLLILRECYGHSPEETQQRLAEGALPGELMLELLAKEPDANKLLAHLPHQERIIEVASSGLHQADSPHDSASDVPSDSIPPWLAKHRSKAQVSNEAQSPFGKHVLAAACGVIFFTSIIPAMMEAGFYNNIFPTRAAATVVAVIGGAIAGIIAYPSSKSYVKGILIGILWGLGVLWTTIIYMQGKDWVLSNEFMLPLMIGSLPAWGLYRLLFHKE